MSPFRGRDVDRADQGGEGAESGQHVVVLSGLSGAGKTAATKLFEDLGYACVDNLPGELLPELADLIASEPARFDRVVAEVAGQGGQAQRYVDSVYIRNGVHDEGNRDDVQPAL